MAPKDLAHQAPEPYTATLVQGEWIVKGTIPANFRGHTLETTVREGLGALTSAWSVYHERRLIDHYIYIVALAVFILNIGAVWGGNKRWQRLCREFESYPKPIRIGGGVVVVALIVVTVIAASHFGAAYSHLPR